MARGPFDGQRDLGTEEAEVEIVVNTTWINPFIFVLQFLKNLFKGDLGLSLKYRHHTVNEIIGQGLPISMALGCLAFLVALGLAFPWAHSLPFDRAVERLPDFGLGSFMPLHSLFVIGSRVDIRD